MGLSSKKADSPSRKRFYSSGSAQEALAATEPAGGGLTKMEEDWVSTQQKTFQKWANSKLAERSLETKNLVEDLKDGVSSLDLMSTRGQNQANTIDIFLVSRSF